MSEGTRKNIAAIASSTVGASYCNLHHFVHDSPWEAESINDRRIEIVWQTRQTRPASGFKLILDDSGHRKSGTATDGVGRQYIGQIGKVDNGMVEVTTHIFDGLKGYPLDVAMYKPASLELDEPRDVWVAVIPIHFPKLEGTRLLAIQLNTPTLSNETEVDYYITNVPSETADAAWIARTYSDRNWIEVFYRETKGWLGMADYQVRDQRSIERHWILVFAAFTFLAYQRFTGGLRRQWSTEPLLTFGETFRVFRHAVECQVLKWLPLNWDIFTAHREQLGLRFA